MKIGVQLYSNNKTKYYNKAISLCKLVNFSTYFSYYEQIQNYYFRSIPLLCLECHHMVMTPTMITCNKKIVFKHYKFQIKRFKKIFIWSFQVKSVFKSVNLIPFCLDGILRTSVFETELCKAYKTIFSVYIYNILVTKIYVQ